MSTPVPGHAGISPDQAQLISTVRLMRRHFEELLHRIGGTDPAAGRMGSDDLTLALRHLEDAQYRAVRHITGGPRD